MMVYQLLRSGPGLAARDILDVYIPQDSHTPCHVKQLPCGVAFKAGCKYTPPVIDTDDHPTFERQVPKDSFEFLPRGSQHPPPPSARRFHGFQD